ncbi:hypothetical protein [Amycolatopsis sp. GM8]|uniref:hypothetical protein n=1 Tax=Amycolatopsis sp. GM8 TaxID=2896530 RepID=UPI001F470EDF|nr:hypothetical protein [Amycolatopsis sp. GM8]
MTYPADHDQHPHPAPERPPSPVHLTGALPPGIDPAGDPPRAGGLARRDDLVLRWDPFSGWAHLARDRRGGRPRFLGFLHLAAPTPAVLSARLAAAGCEILGERTVDEQLVEFRFRLTPLADAGTDPWMPAQAGA